MSRAHRAGFATIALLFFAWGYISANNDPLLVALRQLHSLSWLEALLTHFIFAIAFGTMSLPAAYLCARIGFSRSIPIALSLMVAGAVMVATLVGRADYGAVLGGLFILATGIVLLQVAANPLAAQLGDPARSHWRLNVAQSLNSLGVVIGANTGAVLMLSPTLGTSGSAEPIRSAYLLMAGMTVALALLYLFRLRDLTNAEIRDTAAPQSLAGFRSRWALFGAAAIGLYVGAEVTLSSLMIGFLNQPDVLGTSLEASGQLLANIYWGGALIGRLAGIYLLTRVRAPTLLAVCAAMAILLCGIAISTTGQVAGYAALAVGFANSIMFPTIFTISLDRAKLPAAATSGLLCFAIVGGALLPLAAGHIADITNITAAFALPLAAYVFVAIFALKSRTAVAVI